MEQYQKCENIIFLKESDKSASVLLPCVFTLSILCILNFWGIDPLHMYRNLVREQHSFFLGTVGNKNVTSGYFCMMVPLLLGVFYLCKVRWRKVIYAGMALTGIYAGYAASSDSFLFGCAGDFLILFGVSFSDHQSWTGFFSVCLLFYSGAWLMKLTLLAARFLSIQKPFLLEIVFIY